MEKVETLKKNYEFRNVLSKGKYYIGSQVIIYFLKNNRDINRLGIAINTKLGNAVARNQSKRYIRQVYMENIDTINSGYDIVFLWNKNEKLENASYKQIKEDVCKIFLKSGMIK